MQSTTAMLALAAATGASALELSSTVTPTVGYQGQQVLQCNATAAHFQGDRFTQLSDEHQLDLWGSSQAGTVDVRAPTAAGNAAVRAHFQQECTVVIPDVEATVQEAARTRRQQENPNEWFEAYHEYPEMVSWWQDLTRANPDIMTFTSSIGQSVEGRDMPAVRIAGDLTQTKPAFYLQCQIHAREWISGATCQYIINELINDYNNNDPLARRVLDNTEVHVIPFTNPDGYAYTFTNGNRLWRKNRQAAPQGSNCMGVDLNRNWNDKWNGGGSSSNPCSETYHGSNWESEPETRAAVAYYRSIAPVIGAIDMHSYGQLILRPYGWTNDDSPDEGRLREIGAGMAAAILQQSGRVYQNNKSIGLYITTGAANDWFYGEDATRTNRGYRAAGYTVELRPVGNNPGFQLPPNEIIPTGDEAYQGFRFFLDDIARAPILDTDTNKADVFASEQ